MEDRTVAESVPLRVYWSDRLEMLADRMFAEWEMMPVRDPFARMCVVVGDISTRNWLQRRFLLHRKPGVRRILANIDFKPIAEYFGEPLTEEDGKSGKQPTPVYYVTDEAQQAQYVRMFKDAGLDAVICDTYIDPHFVSFVEYKNPSACRFVRIDADIDGALKMETAEDDGKEVVELFKAKLEGKGVQVKAERLKSAELPAIVNVEEFMRRMSEMNGFCGLGEVDPTRDAVLIVNLNNPTVVGLTNLEEDKQTLVVKQIYYLAMLAYKKLSPEELTDFVTTSNQLLSDYAK